MSNIMLLRKSNHNLFFVYVCWAAVGYLSKLAAVSYCGGGEVDEEKKMVHENHEEVSAAAAYRWHLMPAGQTAC